MIKKVCLILISTLCMFMLSACCNENKQPLETQQDIEQSSTIVLPPQTVPAVVEPDTIPPIISGDDIEIFVGETVDYPSLVTVTDNYDKVPQVNWDASHVKTNTAGMYPIYYTATDMAGNTVNFTLYLTVATKDSPDTTAPAIKGEDHTILQWDSVDYAALVTVKDNRDPSPTLSFDASLVMTDIPGTYPITYTATDEAGNSATLTLQITVLYKDITPPTVDGSDFSITVGDSVSYKKQITVTDDSDLSPKIEVDNSAVDIENPGVYPVVYTVTDASGNFTKLTLYLTVNKKNPVKGPNEDYVLMQAESILASITNDSMSDLQVAYTIYRWTKNNIAYVDTSDKTNWVVGAYDGFRNRSGDCYTYYAVSKALLTAADIDNVDVVKHRTSSTASRHYWLLVNVGDGWYHMDCTRYVYKNANFFMLTDAEISAWDAKYYRGAHTYLKEGLPAVSTVSIQDRVNYNSPNLKY